MIEIIIYLFTALLSIGLVGQAGSSGYLNGAFQRGFAGGGAQIVSANFLISYTNFETYLRACWSGDLGFSGFLFIFSLIFLGAIWINNLVQFRQAVI